MDRPEVYRNVDRICEEDMSADTDKRYKRVRVHEHRVEEEGREKRLWRTRILSGEDVQLGRNDDSRVEV